MSHQLFSQALSQGITFLAKEQERNGCFLSRSSPHQDNFVNSPRFHSTFSTSFILSALSNLPETPKLKKIKEKSSRFLLTQKSSYWSFNYWTRKSKEAKTTPYPDDLDDTFCALSALFLQNKKIITGDVFAHIVKILTTLEEKEGGPYRTWLVDSSSSSVWQDIDLAVNSNIAYFLFLNDIKLPGLDSYIEKEIEKKKISSSYYPSFYPIIYFISRFYKGKHTSKLRQFLLAKRRKDGTWGDSLDTALAVSALLNLHFPPENLKQSLISLVKKQINGHWKAYGFCFDPSRDGKKYFSGSDALTTTFCLEAIHKYQKAILEIEERYEKARKLQKQEKIFSEIMKTTEYRLSFFDSQLKKQARQLILRLTNNSKDKQIPLLPYHFAYALKKNKKIPESLLIQLGTANIFGWIAYTIYDNFFDGEPDPTFLPLANVSLREVTKLLQEVLPKNKDWQLFFHTIMDKIDQVNFWEVTTCRIQLRNGTFALKQITIPNFGSYKKLAEKSLGHGLGPLAILFYLGYTKNEPEVKNFIRFFRHYLIARQLNDDAHDWEKDLAMGQINPVCAMVIKQLSFTKRKRISLKTSMPALQKIFLNEILEKTSKTILSHTTNAKRTLENYTIINDPTFFENLIVKYENSAKTAIAEKKRAVQFINSYTHG